MRKQHCSIKYLVFRATGGVILLLCAVFVQAADKQLIGWLEQVHIGEVNIRLNAKVDTGADSTSIQAKILDTYDRDGVAWVRFHLQDRHDHTVEIERKIIRYVKIKRNMAPSIRRPVVMLGVCLGSTYRDIEVNLSNRKRFKYDMLIGRNYLRGVFLVDAEQEYITRPSCAGIKGD